MIQKLSVIPVSIVVSKKYVKTIQIKQKGWLTNQVHSKNQKLTNY